MRTVLVLVGLVAMATPQLAQVHDQIGGSSYHFSWRANPGLKMTWTEARNYCSSLGQQWQPISIEDRQEFGYVSRVINNPDFIKYIWTSGTRSGPQSFRWGNGAPVGRFGYSFTGGAGVRQPDNREGNEDCLAVLNNFYNDGVAMHDVGCGHTKPVICEVSGQNRFVPRRFFG